MKRAVALLGAQEVDDILAKEGKIEVRARSGFSTPRWRLEEFRHSQETVLGVGGGDRLLMWIGEGCACMH